MTQITIQSILFDASEPYSAGHTCTENEAAVLNAARLDNLRSNFGKKVKAMLDAVLARDGRKALNATEVIELRHEFKQYDAAYEFTALAPRRVLDPIGRAAQHIAQELVAAKLREKGISRSDLPDGQFDQRVAEVAALPRVRAEAERRVSATSGIVADALDFTSSETA